MLDPIIKDRLELVLTHAAKIQRRITAICKVEIPKIISAIEKFLETYR